MRSFNLLFVISTLFLFLTGCDSKNDSVVPQTPPIPVTASPLIVKDVTLYFESIGTLQASVFMEIRPQVSGSLQEVFITEGQWVQRDTPLFQIDPRPYEIKVQEAEALLASDQATLKGSLKKLDRFRDLAEKDLIPQIEWDDLEAQVERAQAAVGLDQSRLASALLDLEHSLVRSPIDGRVGKLDVHPGHLVHVGQPAPLISISKMDPLIVEFSVTEKEFSKMPKESLQIEMKSLCSTDSCRSGTATFLDNHFDSKSGLLLVRGRVDNGDHLLRPGQTVLVRIPIAIESNAKLIPQKAIRFNQHGAYIYVIQSDKTVAIRQLLLGSEQGAEQIVLEGLDSTELVVLDGHLRLSPGLKVEVVP